MKAMASYETSPTAKANRLRLAFRFSCREMRGGLKGFYIFLACIALGVAAIGGVGGIARMIDKEFSEQGKAVLGGDIKVSLTQRAASDRELAFLNRQGEVASAIWMRTMARRTDDQSQLLVEAKAIDNRYPLYGVLKTTPAGNIDNLLGKKDGLYGVIVPQLLLDRLELGIGDHLQVGTLTLSIRAVLEDEPDLLSEGFQLGLRLFMAKDAMEETGLLQPGSLFIYTYKIAINNVSDTQITKLAKQAEDDFPDSHWNIRTRMNAAPVLKSNIDRFMQFLTLVGLTSLVVGGVGVTNAVRSYLDDKCNVIATLKSVGASGSFVMSLYLMQIMLLSLIGIAIGTIFAIIIPLGTAEILRSFLPMVGHGSFYPAALAIGAIFAFLTTLAFALVPLSRARNIPVTALFRTLQLVSSVKPGRRYQLAAGILLIVIAGLAVFTAYDKRMAMMFIVAVIGVFIVLRLLATLIQRIARRFSHVRSTALRLAIGNIYRPGALTGAIVLALGLGLTLLVALATIDGNLRRQLTSAVPTDAPAFFFMDIPAAQEENFRTLIKKHDPAGDLRIMPTLRARITKLNNIPVGQAKIDEGGKWVVRSDRNITYSALPPEGSTIRNGTWWTENYKGPPLVSFSQKEADALNLKIGDTVTVNILGREITAEIANFRTVDWDSMKMNFVMIFSPDTLKNAPHIWLATLTPEKKTMDDAAMMRDIGSTFPSITILSIRNVLDSARILIDQIGLAVRASASIALLASVLVLAGALSASNRARTHDAVVLKTLGATRKMLIRAFVYEYLILGIATAVFAFVAGSVAGIAVSRLRMDINAVFLPQTGISVLVIALVLSVGLGLAGTWRVLGQKPSQWLRDL